MTVNRYFSSTAVTTTLTAGIAGGATSITVAAVTGFPVSYPYTLILDPDGTEELVKVTAAAGTTLTVVRGQDGTSAVAHNSGDTVRHGVSAQDFREPQEHIAATTDIHGLAGGASVVGTSSSQTLTNKTLTTPTIGSFTNAAHTHANAANGGTVAHSALTGLTTGDPHTQYQQESEKAAASGYASLDGSTKVPIAQVPTGTTSSTVSLGNHTHAFSGARGRRTANQSLSDSTWEAVTFNASDDYDTDTYHDATGSPTVFTVPSDGYYQIDAQVVFSGDVDGRRALDIRKNDSSSNATAGISVGKTNSTPGTVVDWYQQTAAREFLSAGDYIKAFVFHTAGGGVSLVGSATDHNTWLAITKLGA